MKDWNDIKSHDSWEIFKIMGEFVEGFERLSRIGPCVSIFGSARTNLDSKYYSLAEELAFQLTQKKFGVITGGGPGIMEAGNKGAKRGGGKSVGLNILLPFEQEPNIYIDKDKIINFKFKKRINSPMTIKVYNTFGQLVYSKNIVSINSNFYSYNFNELESGLYFLTIESDQKKYNNKIILW